MKNLKDYVLNFWIDILLNVPAIGEHSLMVGELSYGVALEFFNDKRMAFMAQAGGILHDIGYIVPRFSPKLYEVEEIYSIIDYAQSETNFESSSHTYIGGYILSNFLGLDDFADVAMHHHTPASELSPEQPSHIIANIVSLADIVSIQVEKSDPSVAKEVAIDIVKTNKEKFFPEVYEAGIKALSKDFIWWIVQDSEIQYIEESGQTKMVDEEELGEMGLFTSYIVDSKSVFTRRHTEGVAYLSKELAKELGLPSEVQRDIFIAGLFHDIGKVSINSSILEKPGPLTKSEYWQMRKHVYYTEKFLRHFEKAGHRWPKWAYQHHERLDGSGYPKRLTAKDLPIESRILQVADVFTAFTEDRPYRKPLSLTQALEIIERDVKNGKMDKDVYLALERLIKNGYTLPKQTMVENIVESVRLFIDALEG